MDVRIGEVVTEMVVTEGIGSLSAEDVQKLVKLVLEQVQQEQEKTVQREHDTSISDRAFPADWQT